MRITGMLLSWVFFGLIFFCADLAVAQGELTTDNKKAIKYYNEANNLLRQRQFNSALIELSKAVEKDPDFTEAYLKMAGIFRTLANFQYAADYYQKAVDSRPNHKLNRGAYLYLGDHYFYEGQYLQSKVMIESFLGYPQLKPANEKRGRFILGNVEFALVNIQKPIEFDPKPLPSPLNNFRLQYFPVLTVDNNTIIFTRRLGTDPRHDEDIYISQKDSAGRWNEPVSISGNINSRMNEGTCTISADGKTLIFTSCQDSNSFGSCDLYISRKTGGQWISPTNIGKPINSSSWESQPSLSADGRTLYFVSNRSGGKGKRDIYYSWLNDKEEWQTPLNLGDTINTEEDDISPFIHVNGQSLYFASEGHLGFGGLDLYLTEKDSIGWSKPKNLGYPLNDNNDQASLFIGANGSKGYYSHEKSDLIRGLIDSKILEFDVPETARVKRKSNFLTGRVYDSETNDYLSAVIELFDLETGKKVSVVQSDPVDGSYSVVLTEGGDYGVYATSHGYLYKNQNYNYVEKVSFKPEVLDIYLDPLKTGNITVLNNIFFDYNSYELKEKSVTELQEVINLLQDNPELNVEIGGHTDNVGSKEYNHTLSLNRARAVLDYLILHNIEDLRVLIKGYGAVQPLVPNDSEENRSKNRRIEFKIL